MEFSQADVNEINGVNLDNYFPYQRNYDTVLYVHKRVLKQEEAEEKAKVKKAKAEKRYKDKINNIANNKANEKTKKESVMEQTVRFAKHLAPMVIPPNEGSPTPIFYTVECSNCRKNHKKIKDVDDATYQKKKCKKIIETYRRERKHERKISTTDSVSHSSQSNTLDDLNNNNSLSYTMSEQSVKREKFIKNEVNSKRKRNKDKFIISESFEAIATDFTNADDAKIKVQLMNNTEKKNFCESIRSPILNAVRECVAEFNNKDIREDIKTVHRTGKHNTDKLDKILDRLANIEMRLQNIEYTQARTKSPQAFKASTLEQLGEDIDLERTYDEEYETVKKIRMKHEDNREDLGCGEVVDMRASTSVGVKTDKPNRLPARFCWTDAEKA